jgi:hypothetical protein
MAMRGVFPQSGITGKQDCMDRMVGQGERRLACPYFNPLHPHPRDLWPHRHRLPLGDGFAGRCAARPAEAVCEDETLRRYCNLGYADLDGADSAYANPAYANPSAARMADAEAGSADKGNEETGAARPGRAGCAYLPDNRQFDAIRFHLLCGDPESGDGAALRVRFACERGHRPARCGELHYDRAAGDLASGDRTAGNWREPPEAWLRPLAEAAVRAWLARHGDEG